MPYLTPKPKSASAWLPSQVAYGIDCSDVDPAKWKPFGSVADQLVQKSTKAASPPEAKADQPAR